MCLWVGDSSTGQYTWSYLGSSQFWQLADFQPVQDGLGWNEWGNSALIHMSLIHQQAILSMFSWWWQKARVNQSNHGSPFQTSTCVIFSYILLSKSKPYRWTCRHSTALQSYMAEWVQIHGKVKSWGSFCNSSQLPTLSSEVISNYVSCCYFQLCIVNPLCSSLEIITPSH